MPLYESVFIARQDINTGQVDTLTEQFSNIITETGGKVEKTEYWGLKNLAYRIKKNRKGHYVLLHVDAEHDAISEMERNMRLNEDVLRHLTLRIEEIEEGPSIMMQNKGRERERGERGDRGDRDRGDRRDRDDRDKGDRGDRNRGEGGREAASPDADAAATEKPAEAAATEKPADAAATEKPADAPAEATAADAPVEAAAADAPAEATAAEANGAEAPAETNGADATETKTEGDS
jgi:small subunit ribosomal protein S6